MDAGIIFKSREHREGAGEEQVASPPLYMYIHMYVNIYLCNACKNIYMHLDMYLYMY